jgi:hypothetical protein
MQQHANQLDHKISNFRETRFFIVRENQNFVKLSERNVGGVSGSNNNLRNTPNQYVDNCWEKNLFTSSGNTKFQNKLN